MSILGSVTAGEGVAVCTLSCECLVKMGLSITMFVTSILFLTGNMSGQEYLTTSSSVFLGAVVVKAITTTTYWGTEACDADASKKSLRVFLGALGVCSLIYSACMYDWAQDMLANGGSIETMAWLGIFLSGSFL